MSQRVTQRFQATDDNGTTYDVEEWTDNNAGTNSEDPDAERSEMTELRLGTGQHLDRLEKGVYQTTWGLTLRSTDPDAP